MKHFTKVDIIYQDILSNYIRLPKEDKAIKKISCDLTDLIINPLWFHKKNLSQTTTGYGKALKTEYMIHYEGRKYRVLYTLFSNSGTYYFKTKNFDIILNLEDGE
jgi:hypothetical protein